MSDESTNPVCKRTCRPLRAAIIALIRGYQCCMRPLLIGMCKFHPTCSEYAVEAVHAHGVARGLRLAMGRILRCHPFGPGGLDPVPPDAPPEK
ncbi:MAG: membrane protein insertion efficiency factor YidD [Phycisphaerae bacterium]